MAAYRKLISSKSSQPPPKRQKRNYHSSIFQTSQVEIIEMSDDEIIHISDQDIDIYSSKEKPRVILPISDDERVQSDPEDIHSDSEEYVHTSYDSHS